VFDGEAFILTSLLGWVSVAVTEDPISVPSFASLPNYEGGVIPKNGFTIELEHTCGTPGTGVAVGLLNLYRDYAVTVSKPDKPVCLPVKEGRLHHFEVTVSQSKIEIYGTPFSADGAKFEAPRLLHSAQVDLPFSRGYVTISVHNHASKKYSGNNDFGATHPYDAWIARWDNVGFDGPIVGTFREYEAPDALVAGQGGTDVGYRVPDIAKGASPKLKFAAVRLDNLVRARLSFTGWYPSVSISPNGYDKYLLKYRMNGGAWKDRPLTAGEIGVLGGGKNQGAIAQTIELAPSDLVAGDNTVELAAQNIGQSYPPLVANVDLVLETTR
jgi:hypothetical protein